MGYTVAEENSALQELTRKFQALQTPANQITSKSSIPNLLIIAPNILCL